MHVRKLYRSAIAVVLPLGLLLVLSQWNTISGNIDDPSHTAKEYTSASRLDIVSAEDKQRGAHVFGIEDSTDFQRLIQNNVEWITLVSWGFQEDYNSPAVGHHDGDSAQIQQHDAAWQKRIEQVRAAGFKVFFKPHIWVTSPTDGTWRSDIFPANDENWELWKASYRDFILRYARIAERANAEMFCMGTEFSRLSMEKPEYWESLIEDIRSIYSGKLTYAANWYKEFEEVTFWGELDYIGIQAYFPLAKNERPSVEEVSKGWKKHLLAMQSTHKRHDRKILFTEMGYRSTASGAIKPWEWIEDSCNDDSLFSAETQANCYRAFFETVWGQDWFAGVHVWQLRSDFVENDRYSNLDFSPQGKPAELVLAKGFE